MGIVEYAYPLRKIMPKQPTAYYRPRSVDEALHLLRQPNTVPLAGGTALLATEEGIDSAVVDLQDTGLNGLSWADDGRLLRIGAMVRLADLDDWLAPLTGHQGGAALLRQAIAHAGPNTYRHAATVGGLVATRLPDSELLAALLAMDATVSLRLPAPETITLAAYLADDEPPPGLITELLVFWPTGRGAAERVARTPADTPIVSVTLWQPHDGAPRLAATGIAPRPLRLAAAEAALRSGHDEAAIAAAAEAARATAKRPDAHPGDFRGDAAYRAEMAAVLTRRVLG
jgi:carbon-monoxide dehydrogenase medium subunit